MKVTALRDILKYMTYFTDQSGVIFDSNAIDLRSERRVELYFQYKHKQVLIENFSEMKSM